MPTWQWDEQTDKCIVVPVDSKLQLPFCADALLDGCGQEFREPFAAGSGKNVPEQWFLGTAICERIKRRIPRERGSFLIEQNYQETRRFEEGFHSVLSKQAGELAQWIALHFISARPAPSELAFEHIHRKVDHRRPAVRAGARRVACFQVDQERTLFLVG